MSSQRFIPEFKDEAEHLGVSAHTRYKWVMTAIPNKIEEDVFDYIEVFYNRKC